MKQAPAYGGQAVIEGVMMRGARGMAIAVRRPDTEIVVKRQNLTPWGKRFKVLAWPFLRGIVAFIEAMVIGIQALTFSASLFAEEEGEEMGIKEIIFTIAFAFLLTFALFVALPAFLVNFVKDYIASNLALNLVEGVIKISFFLLYILAISAMAEVRRVFEYHGAEHKTIHAFEAGEELKVENVRKYSTLHPRCGTSFILLVFLLSILIFTIFGRPPTFWARVGRHLLLMPFLAAISYELIKVASRKGNGIWDRLVGLITAPGMLLQKLTTREPDDFQLEVAILALKGTLDLDTVPL